MMLINETSAVVKHSSQSYMSLSDFSTFDDVTHLNVNPSPFEEIQNSVSELEIKVQEFYMAGSRQSGSGESIHLLDFVLMF